MAVKAKPPRQSGTRRSSLMMTLLLIPVIFVFFLCGVYVGSQFMNEEEKDGGLGLPLDSFSSQSNTDTDINTEKENENEKEITKGLPGTNNVLKRWSVSNMKMNVNMNYLRGAALEIQDIARRAEALVGLGPPLVIAHINDKNTTDKIQKLIDIGINTVEVEGELKGLKRPMMPNSMYNHPPEIHVLTNGRINNGHTVSGTEQIEILKNSLHTTSRSYMVGPSTLDSSNILIGVWVYLDDSLRNDNDMRTIFTNKKSGCENGKDQYGLSMYVNAWETNNHLLYVEYGGLESGCHKLDSSGVQLHSKQWYHVAVYLGDNASYLYIDGTLVSNSGNSGGGGSVSGGSDSGNSNSGSQVEGHQIQTIRPFRVGQYDNAQYPLYGNVSHLAIIHCDNLWTKITIDVAVKNMMDISLVSTVQGLHALYTFTDAITEVAASVAKESVNNLHGIYSFPIPGKTHPGVQIDLIDGISGRLITALMKEDSDKLSRIRREKVKDGMKHAWSGYKKYAWGKDEVKPVSHQVCCLFLSFPFLFFFLPSFRSFQSLVIFASTSSFSSNYHYSH